MNLLEAIGEIEQDFSEIIGMVELDRVEYQLKNLYQRLTTASKIGHSRSLAQSKEDRPDFSLF